MFLRTMLTRLPRASELTWTLSGIKQHPILMEVALMSSYRTLALRPFYDKIVAPNDRCERETTVRGAPNIISPVPCP